MALFPRRVLRDGAPFTPDTDMAEAGRTALARQREVILDHDRSLREKGGPVAVHETRKAIRRTRTLFRLLKPYFLRGTFQRFQGCFKDTMRRLGPVRDLHVLLLDLERFLDQAELHAAEEERLAALHHQWQQSGQAAEEAARRAANRAAYRECLEAYGDFVETAGAGLPEQRDPLAPRRVRHQAAVHIHRRLAAVRAFDEHLPTATVSQLHTLRIRFKELRYTLKFFEPVLGWAIESVLADLDGIQDHLGDLNDASVALRRMAGMEGQAEGVSLYRAAREEQLSRLVDTFMPVWDTFNDVAWRERLAAAIIVL